MNRVTWTGVQPNAPETFDVVIIGGGIVGCAVARALTAFHLDVALVEARSDIGDVTSKANTAILHTGFDATPGTIESQLVRRGYDLLSAYAPTVGIPVERTGALLVAWTDEELAVLPTLAHKAQQNGYAAADLVDAAEVYRREPALGPGALGGLAIPDESIICSWTSALAYVTEAVSRGLYLYLDQSVTGIDVGESRTELATTRGALRTRWVINVAGHGADVIDHMLGHDRFTVVPRKGELIVFDKLSRSLVNSIILPVPSSRGKGVLVSPTIYGNVMLGPTSENIIDRSDTSTTPHGLSFLVAKGEQIMPALLDEEVTTTYAGLRAATEHSDFVIDCDPPTRYVLLGGIRSTGLTASMALGEHVIELLTSAGEQLAPLAELPVAPVMPQIGQAFTRPFEDESLIASDPDYGRIICFCERVSRGEVRDALESAVPPRDIDGLRRRTRVLMGRCQGFYCQAEVEALLNRTPHLNQTPGRGERR